MRFSRLGIVAAFVCAVAATAQAAAFDDDVTVSTAPIGSAFYRHLAFDMNHDLKKLVRYERRGFGRAEILTLLVVSKVSGVPLKDMGERRLRKEASLEDLVQEAGLDYVTVYKIVRVLKEAIEAKGMAHLPPPVYENPAAETAADNVSEDIEP